MRITYIKLQNVAGLIVGSNKEILEISFAKSKNKICCIQGANGVGKSVLLSSLQPFAFVTSLDDRSSIPYIKKDKIGYKEIHYMDGSDEYIIKHYYKPNGSGGHSVKSYFMMNGEELNENGNVTSFNSLVNIHFGITQEMLRLIRLGSNVKSFISLSFAGRKEYISKLIDEMDWYFKVYKTINDDIKVTKLLINSNRNNLYNCHISDIIIEQENLNKLEKEIAKNEKERDHIIEKIGKINSLMTTNNIDDIRQKCNDAESSLHEFSKTEAKIKSLALENASVDKLIIKRSDITESKINIQSKINSYRISIDNTLKSIERLEISMKKITSNNNLQSLTSVIANLKESISSTNNIVKNFIPLGSTSNEVYMVLSKLQSFNQISQMINTFGNKPIDVYIKLKIEGKSVDEFLKNQIKKINSSIKASDLASLINTVFKDDQIIMPNCDTEYVECPYYRLSTVIDTMMNSIEDGNYDDETLRSIKIISNNIDNILNEIDVMLSRVHIPDSVKADLTEIRILERLKNRLPFFSLSDLQEYLAILKEYEIYTDNIEKLKQFESQLLMYKNSGIESQEKEIQSLRESVEFYKNNISTLETKKVQVDKELAEIDEEIALVTKYNDSKKYKAVFESTLESTRKILEPLENAANEKMKLDFQLDQITNAININRETYKSKESKINEYNRLTKEGYELTTKLGHLTMIAESVSTKKGIPVKYMKRYLETIQKVANDLLSIIYKDKLKLAKFHVDPDAFEIPYTKNGTRIQDVKYASQSEIPSITMALSFALANRAASKYNILLMDEVDAGFDDNNRSGFLKMTLTMLHKINAEQSFIISHNVAQMLNIPMDCIKLSDIGISSKLQNVIYE